MKQLSLFKVCRVCKRIKYRHIICDCIAENKKKRKGNYYKNHRIEILKKIKTKKNRKRRYENQKRYRATNKGKAATNRAYINQILKRGI